MFKFVLIIFTINLIRSPVVRSLSSHLTNNHDSCSGENKLNNDDYCSGPVLKYIFYDVNPSEGFNLRRDVYMRVAQFVKQLNQEYEGEIKWTLVLPPWNSLYHWKNRKHIDQSRLKWSLFFNITELNKYVPVIELDELLNVGLFNKFKFTRFYKKGISEWRIDKVYHLEGNFDFKNGDPWTDLANNIQCKENIPYFIQPNTGLVTGSFWNYENNIYANKIECYSFRGNFEFFAKTFISDRTPRSIMIDRAETVIHSSFADIEYWNCRKSMIFSNELITISQEIRNKLLNSYDPIDYHTKKTYKRETNKGGPYVAVHLRRGDFINRKTSVSIKHASLQVKNILTKLDIDTVYLATDGTQKDEFKSLLIPYNIINYAASNDDLIKYKDAGIAIIEQIICAHSKFFIGTQDSTYSFRIQEEREILGFNPSSTFNCFCNDKYICETSKWLFQQ